MEVNLVWWYYAFKIKWFLKLLMEGENCLTSSNNLNILFSNFVKTLDESRKNNELKGYTKSLAFEALKIHLPNPDTLSLEDILEIKLRLKDELALFSETINSIETKNKQLFDFNIRPAEYQAMFFNDVQKPLRELETKMKNLKSRTFRKFVERMQNPKSYVPLIGTIAASVPMQYTLLASLGMVTGQSYLEFKEEKRGITDNGLYFLLKIKK